LTGLIASTAYIARTAAGISLRIANTPSAAPAEQLIRIDPGKRGKRYLRRWHAADDQMVEHRSFLIRPCPLGWSDTHPEDSCSQEEGAQATHGSLGRTLEIKAIFAVAATVICHRKFANADNP
jgi:hypothetical protein